MVIGDGVSLALRRYFVPLLALLVCVGAWCALAPSEKPAAIRPGWSILRPPDDVNALVFLNGTLIAGGRDGLAAIDPVSSGPASLPGGDAAKGLEATYVKALLVDHAGRLWVGHRNGVLRWDGAGWKAFRVDAGTAPGPVSSMIETAKGEILVGGEAGLASMSDAGLVPVTLPSTSAGTTVTALHEDRRGRLWVGFAASGRGGVLLRDGGSWRAFGLEDGLAHLSVNAIFEDRVGRIHLATGFSGRGGACREAEPDAPSRWICIGTVDGLASDMVRVVFEDSHGQLWYGSEFDGLAVRRGSSIRRLGRAEGLAGSELKVMLEDPAGNLWLGCDKGLTRIAASAAVID